MAWGGYASVAAALLNLASAGYCTQVVWRWWWYASPWEATVLVACVAMNLSFACWNLSWVL